MFSIILLLSLLAQTESAQPYFPSQITFVAENSDTGFTYAIDEPNQRAFLVENENSVGQLYSYVMEHFPNAAPDSPESKYYVLLDNYQQSYCQYSTVWLYGSDYAGIFFPAHWNFRTEYKISNYMYFDSDMVLSNSSEPDEDYWHSVTYCTLDSGDVAPCQEIYFKKNTEIPLRYRAIKHPAMLGYQYTINFRVISIGKPDDRLFDTIPQNWQKNCTDLGLGLECDQPTVLVNSNKSVIIRIRMTTPPHKENGNDTMILRLQVDEAKSVCVDCITWEPKEFVFNSENFHDYQNITLTRVKDGYRTALHPFGQGGGFENATRDYTIYVL